jgi:hypothetical protein
MHLVGESPLVMVRNDQPPIFAVLIGSSEGEVSGGKPSLALEYLPCCTQQLIGGMTDGGASE